MRYIISIAPLYLLLAACSLHSGSLATSTLDAAAQHQHVGLIHVAPLTTTAGDMLEVPITAEGVHNVKDFSLGITYPSSALTIKYVDGQRFNVAGTERETADGSTTLRVTGSAAQAIMGPSILATLHFDVKEGANGQVQLSIADLGGDVADADAGSARITIRARPPVTAPPSHADASPDNRAAAIRLSVFETGMSAPPAAVVMQFQGILATLGPYCIDPPDQIANAIIAKAERVGARGNIDVLSALVQSTLLRAANDTKPTGCVDIMNSL